MSECKICNRPISPGLAICSECRGTKNTQLFVFAIIAVVVFILMVLGGFTFFVLNHKESPPPGAETANGPLNGPVSSTNIDPVTKIPIVSPASLNDPQAISRYADSLKPIIVDVRSEMSNVIIDLKEFLKKVNNVKGQDNVRREIDSFREQMKGHNDKFGGLSNSLKAFTPPTTVSAQHEKLAQGVKKYQTAIQGYIGGLSAYKFEQIRDSQKVLEEADADIRVACEDFEKAIANLQK